MDVSYGVALEFVENAWGGWTGHQRGAKLLIRLLLSSHYLGIAASQNIYFSA